ncbi:MAG: putative manganese transporter [Anaeroplasma sp.]
MLDVLLDVFLDSLKVLIFAFVIYVVLSFFENKITKLFNKHRKLNPIIGSAVGIIPQCGISVVAADLYLKSHITMGTLTAVFFACSDEALPILLSDSSKIFYTISLLLIKFIFGFIIGYMVDFFIKEKTIIGEINEVNNSSCCHTNGKNSSIYLHVVHPLIHSLKIFIYVLIVNFIFGFSFYFIGEQVILDFLNKNQFLSPLLSSLIGLIPNCASSVLITELFTANGIPFAALVSGLCVNAGLGIIYLFKSRKKVRYSLVCLVVLFLSSNIVGYLVMLCMKIFNI